MTESLNATYEVHADGSVSGTSHHGSSFHFGAELLTREYGGGAEYGAYLEKGGFRPRALAFPSGSVLQLAGGHIVRREEPEPIRPALTWATETLFDAFGPEFVVKSGYVAHFTFERPATAGALPANANLLKTA